MANLTAVAQAVATGKTEAAALVTQALQEGVTADRIVSEAIEPALQDVERKYQSQEIYMPDILLAKRAVEGCLTALGDNVTGEAKDRVRSHLDRLQSLFRKTCTCGTTKR